MNKTLPELGALGLYLLPYGEGPTRVYFSLLKVKISMKTSFLRQFILIKT